MAWTAIISSGSAKISFDRIGPYDLSRGDLVAAAIIVSFVTSPMSVRLRASFFVLLALTIIVAGAVLGEITLIALGVFLALWIFVVAPALRCVKRSKDIYLEYSADGIVAETPQIRTTYKWATIGTAKKVGPRLFVMISDRMALVVPDRSTSPGNMERLLATLTREGAAAAG